MGQEMQAEMNATQCLAKDGEDKKDCCANLVDDEDGSDFHRCMDMKSNKLTGGG